MAGESIFIQSVPQGLQFLALYHKNAEMVIIGRRGLGIGQNQGPVIENRKRKKDKKIDVIFFACIVLAFFFVRKR
ncbi:MAG: hypothetical protein HY885_06245 [Deltaproteobacteria bacterium]|nr:hypothetical protein [Deltaproteobacteria bacterium]